MHYYLAIDIGASSGRHIVGWQEGGVLRTKEVYRFPNGVTEVNGHLTWDIRKLFSYVVSGILEAFKEYPTIECLSIDTWGVDYVLLKGEEEVYPVYAYRDGRTGAVIPQIHEKMSFSELYRHTGCQFQPFNTIYQLYHEKLNGRLEGVTDLLMIPEYLMWKLSGVKAREYTNATTMGMVNAEYGEFDREIIDTLGYPSHLFPKLSQPGTVLGNLRPEIAEAVGGNCKVILCATHDTGSAVEGIPMEVNQPYISSGTWPLLGVKTSKPITDRASEEANYSNEGGVGYNRYQKNIMGMWLVNELRRDICPELPFPEIVKTAEESTCGILVDANAQEFLAPKSMKAAFDKATGGSLHTIGDYFRCAYRSLAVSYQKAIEELEANTRNMGARPFAKKLSCGCCGSLFRSKRIDNTWYWVCRKHEESNTLCEMPSVPENEIKAAFQRLYYNLKYNTAVLDFYVKHLILVRNRQMLWSPAVIELNKEISDILDQSHTLSLLNRQGMVDPDIFITKNNQLAERLRKAKLQKEKLHNLEHDQVIDQTQQLQETLLTGPEILDAFDEELFCELIDRITVQSNTQVRFRLKNGLELTESMERTVR